MDRHGASASGTGDLACRSSAEDFALPSRGEALVALRSTLLAQAGPVLVTGNAGVGKTWLSRRLQAEMPPSWRWLVVDIPPAIDPTGLYALIGHSLGLPARGVGEGSRLALTDHFREATTDGIHWALVLDEAHNGSAALLEEVRIMANRLGRAGGPSALMLVGQTSLACRLATRPMNALSARLAAHVHLRGLDVDESRALLDCLVPDLDWDERTLEWYHRDAAGNPRRMLQAARDDAAFSAIRPHERPRVETPQLQPRPQPPRPEQPRIAPAAPTPLKTNWDTPVMGPGKPPLRVGDGMIEVGWEPDQGPASGIAPAPEPIAASAPAPTTGEVSLNGLLAGTGSEPESGPDPESEVETVEPIDDHYAALQAWNEWARNQGRNGVATTVESIPALARIDQAVDSHGDPTQGTTPAGVWVEGQQGFAPYGQLFSRLRQMRDANESS